MNDSVLIDRLVRGLPATDKQLNAQILALSAHGWTGREIADRFGLTLNAVQARASRARRSLQPQR